MIIAVDFDGILCTDKFPEIGEPNYKIISQIRELMDLGCEGILWTSRVDKPLEKAIEWCIDRGLTFTAVNEGAPSNLQQYKGVYESLPRKVYADVYIDDHSIEFVSSSCYSEGISNIEKLLERLIENVKQKR